MVSEQLEDLEQEVERHPGRLVDVVLEIGHRTQRQEPAAPENGTQEQVGPVDARGQLMDGNAEEPDREADRSGLGLAEAVAQARIGG
jgi:hypothetical protein